MCTEPCFSAGLGIPSSDFQNILPPLPFLADRSIIQVLVNYPDTISVFQSPRVRMTAECARKSPKLVD